ncbi:MAG: hypothetical protein BMS9Abin07_0449 [Acidimicrobiia bacterium]|nr:MAG: hypothetical protein BMS9Abin07_0449 [Acidimicrobiia bacterium]
MRAVEVRTGNRDDLKAIKKVTLQACSEAMGELIPSRVVIAETRRRFPTASICEHILAGQLLVGVDGADRIEVVCLMDEREDRLEMTTVLAPVHPAKSVSGVELLAKIRSMGWLGAVTSECVLGNLPHEQFHEVAGFSPGEVEVSEWGGHDVFKRKWWLGPADGTDR